MPTLPPPRRLSARAPRETDIQQAIREALGLEPDLVLWRNSIAGVEEWDPKTGKTRYHRAGLPPGSADLIGILTLPIETRGCVVQPLRFGIFFALEIKTSTGRVSDEQEAWLALVRKRGGFACVVRSVQEAKAALDRARRGERE